MTEQAPAPQPVPPTAAATPKAPTTPYTVDSVFGNKEQKIEKTVPAQIYAVVVDLVKSAKLTKEETGQMKATFVEGLNKALAMPEPVRWRLGQLAAQSWVSQLRKLTRARETNLVIMPLSVQVPHPGEVKAKTSRPGIILTALALSTEAEHPYDDVVSGWISGLISVEAADKFAAGIHEGKIYDVSAPLPTEGTNRLFIEASQFNFKSERVDGVPQFADPFGRFERKIKPSTVADLLSLTDPDKKTMYLLKELIITDSRTSAKNGQQSASITVLDGSLNYSMLEKFRGGLSVRLNGSTMHLAARKGSIVSLVVSGNKYQAKVKKTVDGVPTDMIEDRVGWNASMAKVTVAFTNDQSVPDPSRVIGNLPAAEGAGDDPDVQDI